MGREWCRIAAAFSEPPPHLPCPEEHGAEHEQVDDDDDEYFAHDLRNRHPLAEQGGHVVVAEAGADFECHGCCLSR